MILHEIFGLKSEERVDSAILSKRIAVEEVLF